MSLTGSAVEAAPHSGLDAAWLDRYAAASAFLSRVFLAPPDGPLLVQLSGPGVLEEWPLRDPESRTGLELLRHSFPAETLEPMNAEYRRLFLGPERVLACPYESVYLSEEHLTFGPETLAVRHWYHRYGVRAPAEGREPDDHIGLELGFVSHLCLRGLDAVEDEDEEGLDEAFGALGDFTTAHLLRWADHCLDHVAEHADTYFYRGIAGLARGLLRGLEADLAGE